MVFTRFKYNLKLLGALLGKVKEVSQSAHEKGWKNRQSIIESPQLCPNLTQYYYITLEEYFVLHRYDLEKGTEF